MNAIGRTGKGNAAWDLKEKTRKDMKRTRVK